MRRRDREMTELEDLRRVLVQAPCCHLAMALDGQPYVVPMNFGFTLAPEQLTLVFHSASAGRKLDMLRANPRVSFCVDTGHQFFSYQQGRSFSMAYESVMGAGAVEFLTGREEKRAALDLLVRKYTDAPYPPFSEALMDETVVFRVVAREFSGKRRALK